MVLVTAVAYFAATFLGQQMKLRILCEKLLIISQRFFGIPPFRFYALADGIRRMLSTGIFSPPPEPPASLQLEAGPWLGRLKILGKLLITFLLTFFLFDFIVPVVARDLAHSAPKPNHIRIFTPFAPCCTRLPVSR